MEIISLKCNNCAADLAVNSKTTYLTCTSCGSSLAIKRSANTAYTEVLEDVRSNTEILIDQSEQILIEKKIARLDRDWELERERYRIKDKDGGHFPDEEGGSIIIQIILGGIILIMIGGFLMFWISKAPSEMKPFGQLMLAFIIISVIAGLFTGSGSTSKYKKAKAKYLAKRAALLKELNQ